MKIFLEEHCSCGRKEFQNHKIYFDIYILNLKNRKCIIFQFLSLFFFDLFFCRCKYKLSKISIRFPCNKHATIFCAVFLIITLEEMVFRNRKDNTNYIVYQILKYRFVKINALCFSITKKWLNLGMNYRKYFNLHLLCFRHYRKRKRIFFVIFFKRKFYILHQYYITEYRL